MEVWSKTLAQIVVTSRVFLQRHWQSSLRLRRHLRLSEEAFHLLLAGGVGVIGGLANLLFYLCTESVKNLMLRHRGDLAEIAEILNWWQCLLAPALGGLAAGLVLYWGIKMVGSQGSTNLLEVVVAGDGRLPFRSGLIKVISSILSISSGASMGREGSIIQLSATLSSKWGQLAHWHPYRLRLMVACGAASGMAAAYNAPLAGAIFAAQIVLGNFSMNLFGPVVFSSVVASIVSRTFFGIEPWYEVPSFEFTRLGQLPWFLLLGGLVGMLGAGFLKLLRLSEVWFNRLPLRLYSRMALSGLAVGAISIFYPWVWGNGYSGTNQILHEPLALQFLIGLLLAKVVATLLTLGSGAVGGILTPTLFMGAAVGSVLGVLLHTAGFASELPNRAFALAGMGSMLAATTHSPLLAIVMLFEISLNYSMMPPLMLACAVATLVARQLHPDSIYTEPLRRKGLELERESPHVGAATQNTVGSLMRNPVPPVLETAPFQEIVNRFLTDSNNFLPVVDRKNRLRGLIALQDLKEQLNPNQEISAVIAYDLMRPAPVALTPDQRLLDVLPILLSSEQRNLPVVNNATEKRLIGALVRAEALGVLSEAIASRSVAHA